MTDNPPSQNQPYKHVLNCKFWLGNSVLDLDIAAGVERSIGDCVASISLRTNTLIGMNQRLGQVRLSTEEVRKLTGLAGEASHIPSEFGTTLTSRWADFSLCPMTLRKVLIPIIRKREKEGLAKVADKGRWFWAVLSLLLLLYSVLCLLQTASVSVIPIQDISITVGNFLLTGLLSIYTYQGFLERSRTEELHITIAALG